MKLAAALSLLLVACWQQPERVFVPGKPFTHAIYVRTAQGPAASVRVGEWLTLHAVRETGPWVEVQRRSLGPDGCWVAPPPPPEESEVADNVHWTGQPEGKAEFNVTILDDHTRRVRFPAAGRYVLRATSTTWCAPRAMSNELTVVVTE
jgi:hypothetical protein